VSMPSNGDARMGWPTWLVAVRQEVDRLQVEVKRLDQPPLESADLRLFDSIRQRLDEAELTLERLRRSNWWRRVIGAGAYERCLGVVFEVAEDLLELLPADDVRAQVPMLRAALKTYLGTDDVRYDDFSRLLDEVAKTSGPS
jgi:hypothetical protein